MRCKGGYRTVDNFRYKLIKRYKHRAEKFLENAITEEEREAWKKVVEWFDSILKRNRYVNKYEAICLKEKDENVFDKK